MNQNVDKQQNFMKWLKETPTYTTTFTPQATNTTKATTNTARIRYEGYDKQEEQFRNATTTTSVVQQQQQETINKFTTNIKKVSGKPKPEKSNRPKNITTQIAKISYKSDSGSKRRSASKESFRISSHHRNNDDNISPPPPITHESRTSLTSVEKIMDLEENKFEKLKEFAKKKQERDQEISEIQEMLNKIKSPKKSTTQHKMEDMEKKENDNLEKEKQAAEEVGQTQSKEKTKMYNLGRSKTELEMGTTSKTLEESLNLRNSRRDTARSSNTQIIKPRSKSSQLPITHKDAEPAKKIGYNPIDARRFMENQKKQRKASNLAHQQIDSTKLEKELIKKRLEELKKNSRKLVSKNLQKKQNTITNKPTFKEQEDHKNLDLKAKETFVITNSKEHKEQTEDLKGLSLDLQQPMTAASKTDRPIITKKVIPEKTSRSSNGITTILAPPSFPLLENHKRIGLLRKSENDKDFNMTSHRAINLDKENLALEQLTNKLQTPLEVRLNKEKKELRDQHQLKTKAQENENDLKEKPEETKDISLKAQSLTIEDQVSDLDVPQNTTLKTNATKEPLQQQTYRKEDIAEKEERSAKPLDLPYWLRPSAAQVYPYNFIMAVRRKLEAIAQPHTQAVISHKQHQCTSTTDLDTDLHLKLKKRKSLEDPEEQEVKKLKKKDGAEEDKTKSSKEEDLFNEKQKQIKVNSKAKIEEQPIKPVKIKESSKQQFESLKELKPLPKSKTSYRLEEEPKITYSEEQPVSQFQYLKKSIQSKDFVDVKPINWQKGTKTKSFMDLQTIPPFKKLQKSSAQEDHFKLPKNYKSMESLNSEIHSNLSSISLHNPISNTLTEVSSLRTESRRTFNQPSKTQQGSLDDVTSISSHIFSSPEKKCNKYQDFEFAKPRPVSPLSLEKVDKLKIKRKDHGTQEKDVDNEDLEMDFSQLLEDFNRSLSQVIQVNEQLKCTLDKSQQILSPRTSSSKKSSEMDKQYSSDFESSTHPNKHTMDREKLKENLQNNNENLKQRKQQLFEMAEKVKPLLSPQKTLKYTGAVLMENQNFDINLKSLNNSSIVTQEDSATTTENKEESFETPQVYEERLQQIEQLKINLKQTLLDSQKERQESARLKAHEQKSKREMKKDHNINETSQEINRETKNVETTRKKSSGIELLSSKENKSNDYKENRDKPKNQQEKSKFNSKKQSGNETLYENEQFCKEALSANKQILKENKYLAQYDSEAQRERYKENSKNYHQEQHDLKDKYLKQIKKSLVERNGNETQSTFKSSQNSDLDSLDQTTSQNVKVFQKEHYGNETYLNKKSLETHNRSSSITNSSGTQYLDSNTSQSAAKAQNHQQNYRDSKLSNDYSFQQSTTNSNNSSPVKSLSTNPTHHLMETPKSLQKHKNSGTNNYTSKHTESETGTLGQRQSDIEDKSPTKSQQPDALSSSIAEELQNTFESASQDNENIPLLKNTSAQSTKNHSKHNESSAFINSHINRSRGDFQQIDIGAAKLNETKFQQAILTAAQLSSTEFAQSADDEVTSSENSKTNKNQSSNPPSYNAISSSKHYKHGHGLITTSPSKSSRRISIGSEIVRFFHQYDSEKSPSNSKINDTMSESSLNYSNIGLYDKLIQNETTKSQHLMALLKMREKALLDRTKGQIAWLEVQKARYKAKGLLSHIAAIKKKQRGILLKMEKEREEIKRLLQSTTKQTAAAAPTTQTLSGGAKSISHHNTPTKHKRERLPSSATSFLQPPLGKLKSNQTQSIKSEQPPLSAPILRATYELESSQALEELLLKREDDLRRRREHVERLMQWHQRLDEEEAEVLNLERQLLNYNNVPQVVEQQQTKLQTPKETTEKLTQAEHTVAQKSPEAPTSNQATIKTPEKKRASRARKMEKRLKEIDKSLRELSHISASSTNSTGPVMGQSTNNDMASDSVSMSSAGTHEVDFVRTTGIKLNKLWKRLTSQQMEKYEPSRRYKLCKSDLERLYEEAKMAVLRDFAEDEDRLAQELLEKSSTNLSSTTSPIATVGVQLQCTSAATNVIEIPVLNLNFSSGNSEPEEEESANNSNAQPNLVVAAEGNYSPSVAEENFKAHLLNSSASSSSSESTEQRSTTSSGRIEQRTRLENNVQMFLAITQRITTAGRVAGLQRSLSDTEIADKPKFCAATTTATSQKNIATTASQSNSNYRSPTIEHQRSKSSIVELTTNIPLKQTETETPPTDHTDIRSSSTDQGGEVAATHSKAHLKDLENESSSRSSVIRSIGKVTPIKSGTSSDIPTLTEDSKTAAPSTECTAKDSFKHKSTFSGQVSEDCETKAKEISSKLEEISLAVSQLSKSNALPSYASVTHTKTKSSVQEQLPVVVTTSDDSNLSTDASSYSFNFENISTDRHSSPGISEHHNLHTKSTSNRTITSITYTKDNTVEDEELETTPEVIPKDSSSGTVTFTSAGTSSSPNSTNSKTFVQDQPKSSYSSVTLTQSLLDQRISVTYEADFEPDLSNETHIEDITIPTFEITGDDDEDDVDESNNHSPKPSSSSETQDLVENLSTEASDKTYCADAAKDSSYQTIEQPLPKPLASNLSTSPDKELQPAASSIPLPPPPPPPPLSSSLSPADASSIQNSNHLMPDIINELELRRHQLILENEHLKQYEHVTAVPYMYVREIPNKPPPPYVPPAHGSPMTTIFPSEERIKDITYRRTHELYCELLKTEYCNETGEKLPSVMEEQITNIYERIILDICREYLQERGEILRDGDPTNFHSQLAFFNPPNRLRCIQDAIYKEVRVCLAMDKTQPKRTQIYSIYGQRAKQDHIGKIIIQEMYDEDDRWCNFHREESEVLHLMVEEMLNKNIKEIAKDVLIEEGGTIEDEEEDEVDEEKDGENDENQEETTVNEEIAGITENQTHLQSSIFIETINDEDDEAHCLNETQQSLELPTKDLQQDLTLASSSASTDDHNNDKMNPTNAVQTCT